MTKLILYLGCLILFWFVSEGYLHLYHSRYPLANDDHDCFYDFEHGPYELARHLVSYCIRHRSVDDHSKGHCLGTEFTFSALRSQNVVPSDLFRWFAPIDVIDDYSSYLSTAPTNDQSEQSYCNCTDPLSFGEYCQYRHLTSDEERTMNGTIHLSLRGNLPHEDDLYLMDEHNSTTCYTSFNCTTHTGFCLDWREIGDGFTHCIDGLDEKDFVSMELNDCDAETEYRCRNGLCIPRSFLLDRTLDCPDWYDEQIHAAAFKRYARQPCLSTQASAACEEHRHGLNYFSCGNGEHMPVRFWGSVKCSSFRHAFLLKAIFRPYYDLHGDDDVCHRMMLCLFEIICLFEHCPNGLQQHCDQLMSDPAQKNCPKAYFFPPGPFVFPFIRLLYNTSHIWEEVAPDYVCWNRSLCDIYRFSTEHTVDGFQCVPATEFSLDKLLFSLPTHLLKIFRLVLAIYSLFSDYVHPSTHPRLYQCVSRLSISRYRVNDIYYNDCFPWILWREEEARTVGNTELGCDLPDRFRCGLYECVPRVFIQDTQPDCEENADELLFVGCTDEFDCQHLREVDLSKEPLIYYQEICDGHDIFEVFSLFRTSNETDETDCELWPCDAPYTRCDGKWNRPNGCDELNCPLFPPSTCRGNEQPCAQFNSSTVGCIPLAKAGDGHFDCLFGSDEAATLLKRDLQILWNPDTDELQSLLSYNVPCWNSLDHSVSAMQICDGSRDCPQNDDELFCNWLPDSKCNTNTDFACKNGTCISKEKQLCNHIIDCWPDGEDERLCHVFKPRPIRFSTLLKEQYLPLNFDRFVLTERHRMKTECHRGVAIYNEESQTNACLCPPSYYGIHCEQQSERLSIFYRVDVPPEFDRRSIYWLVFYLIDQDGRVLTYEKHLYVGFNRQFSQKQLIYLPYPRSTEVHSTFSPKFVQIDTYRVTNASLHSTDLSWFYAIPFSTYLPVTRLAALLYLESASKNQRLRCQNLTRCDHGSCQIYLNTVDPFCRCDDAWFGIACDQKRPTDLCATLHCSDRFSKCIVHKDHAFCLCSVGHLGPKCQIPFDSCSSAHCRNNGTCVSLDERTISHVCVCPSSHFGDQCQHKTAQLKLTIPPSNISHIPVLLIHFLQLPVLAAGVLVHQDIFFFRNIHSRTQLTIDITDQAFIPPVVLAQSFFSSTSTYGHYYLLSLSNGNRSQLTVDLQESHRCPDINERFNSTLTSARQLKRLKFYHLYTKELRCFHDEFYMCLVDRNGFPDCLIYNHNVSMCIERNYCENEGRCLQRKKLGQLEYLCACPQCTAGVFCQIQMNEYSLTLDSIYGPIVLTDVSLHDQPVVIKISIVLICLMFIVGLISNICSFLVFRHKDIQQIGCGRYLLVLSIVNQVTITLFTFRVIYLLINQIIVIGNVRLLRVSCYLLDFVLQACISFCDWLHTCIACERTFSTLKGAHFNRSQSVRKSKFVIPVLGLLVVGTSIHQVFNHVLIADPRSDARLWCVIKYPREWLRTYEICLNIINNFVPLCINLIAGVILLVSLAKNRHRVSRKERYQLVLITQMRQHKDLLTAPMTILVAKIPFLLIGISIKCIREGWHTYLSLSAYYLSLIPLISTFLIFVCPSSSYMGKFKEQLGRLTLTTTTK